MHFHANFKNFYKDRRFIIKKVWIKNICDAVELYRNL